MLGEEQIDGHLVLVRHLGHDGEAAGVAFLVAEFVALVGEIELGGWIGDDVVELAQAPAVIAVEGMENGIALNDLGDGLDEVVEDELEPQQACGFLRDVVGEDGAAILAEGVGEIHEQGAGAAGGIVTGDVFHRLRDEAGSHDFGDGAGRVLLGVFAAAVLVGVLDEVFEEVGDEVEFFREGVLEGEVDDLVDDGAGEFVAQGGDVFGDGIEEHDFFAILGFHGEDVGLGEGGLDAFALVGEFVVEELVEDGLGDDLVFVVIIV